METPTSIRRVTRSQARASAQKKVTQEQTPLSRGDWNRERAALLDISNDSPILGVAKESTALSSFRKPAALPPKTPGSGESLLRQQVKILLEKADEKDEFKYKPFFPGFGSYPTSPRFLEAPKPVRIPQLFNFLEAIEEKGEERPNDYAMRDVFTVLPMVASDSVEYVEEPELIRVLQFDSPTKSGAYEASSSNTYYLD